MLLRGPQEGRGSEFQVDVSKVERSGFQVVFFGQVRARESLKFNVTICNL